MVISSKTATRCLSARSVGKATAKWFTFLPLKTISWVADESAACANNITRKSPLPREVDQDKLEGRGRRSRGVRTTPKRFPHGRQSATKTTGANRLRRLSNALSRPSKEPSAEYPTEEAVMLSCRCA